MKLLRVMLFDCIPIQSNRPLVERWSLKFFKNNGKMSLTIANPLFRGLTVCNDLKQRLKHQSQTFLQSYSSNPLGTFRLK